MRTEKPGRKHLRGRPTKAFLATLVPMTDKHYRQLEKACIEAYLLGHTHVILALSYIIKLPDDFPPAHTVSKEGKVWKVKVKVKGGNGLLKWLNDHGYSTVTASHIQMAGESFTRRLQGLLS